MSLEKETRSIFGYLCFFSVKTYNLSFEEILLQSPQKYNIRNKAFEVNAL